MSDAYQPKHANLTVEGYEAACARFDAISETYSMRRTELIDKMHELDAEYDDASADLHQYEQSPGIPLPQFREHTLEALRKILGA